MKSRNPGVRRWLFVLVIAAVVSAPSAASAAVVTTGTDESGTTFVAYVADAGVLDDVVVSRPTTGDGYIPGQVQFHSPYHKMRIDGSECTTAGDPGSTNIVQCPQKQAVLLLLEDGNDKTEVGSELGDVPVLMLGGPGDDLLDGGPGSDMLAGQDGNDRFPVSGGENQIDGGDGSDLLLSGPGNESLAGGPGDDTIEEGAGGGGADEMSCGDGADLLLFDEHGPVSVSLDDQAGDGAAGEGDNARADIENVTVDAGGSSIVGSDAPNVLRSSGRGGRTVLDGRGGNDVLRGDVGPEQLIGGDGDDELIGGFGDDELNGGGGKDSYVADEVDSSFGTGADVILAADGVAETVSCGPGPDRATLDAGDLVTSDPGNLCEEIDRGSAPQTETDTTPPVLTVPALRGGRLRGVLRRGVRVRLTCDEACTATVSLRLPRKTARRLGVPAHLATATARLAAGKTGTVLLRPKPAHRRRLARARSLRLRVEVAAVDAGGNRATSVQTPRLRR